MASGTISFELSTDITYVAGTVNGVETVFIQDEAYPVKWRAAVDVAEDSLYHIYLEMYDEAGNKSTYENTIEYILPWFIYDRTQEDVDRVQELRNIGWENMTDSEKTEWQQGMKGAFNLSDVRRNENNCYVIAQLLNISLVTCKDNLPTYPDKTYFDSLLKNVTKIAECRLSVCRDTGSSTKSRLTHTRKLMILRKYYMTFMKFIIQTLSIT